MSETGECPFLGQAGGRARTLLNTVHNRALRGCVTSWEGILSVRRFSTQRTCVEDSCVQKLLLVEH